MAEIVIRRNDRVVKIATLSLARGGEGYVYFTDAAASGGSSVSNEAYQDSGGKVLQSFDLTGGLGVMFTIRASYPIVIVNGVEAELAEAEGIGGFEGTVIKTLALGEIEVKAQVKTPNDGAGASATVVASVS